MGFQKSMIGFILDLGKASKFYGNAFQVNKTEGDTCQQLAWQ